MNEIDVLVIAADELEYDAARAVDAGALEPWREAIDSTGCRVLLRRYSGARDPLTFVLAMEPAGTRLIDELDPRCVATWGHDETNARQGVADGLIDDDCGVIGLTAAGERAGAERPAWPSFSLVVSSRAPTLVVKAVIGAGSRVQLTAPAAEALFTFVREKLEPRPPLVVARTPPLAYSRALWAEVTATGEATRIDEVVVHVLGYRPKPSFLAFDDPEPPAPAKHHFSVEVDDPSRGQSVFRTDASLTLEPGKPEAMTVQVEAASPGVYDLEIGVLASCGTTTATSWLRRLTARLVDAPTLDALLEALRDPSLNRRERHLIVLRLATFPSTDVVDALRDVLAADPEWILREGAAMALGHLRDARAVDALVAAMQRDGDDRVREKSAFALGQIGARETAEAVREAMATVADLSNMSGFVMAALLLGDRQAVPQLVEIARRCTREHEDLAALVAQALAALTVE